jgi:hypothetical protein
MIRVAPFHRGDDAQGLVNPREVVMREMGRHTPTRHYPGKRAIDVGVDESVLGDRNA